MPPGKALSQMIPDGVHRVPAHLEWPRLASDVKRSFADRDATCEVLAAATPSFHVIEDPVLRYC